MKDDTSKSVVARASDRRLLLKSLAAGSAIVTGTKTLPNQWTKPLANAISLPGHAATTINDYAGGDSYNSDGDGLDEDYLSEELSGDFYLYSYGDRDAFSKGDDGSDTEDSTDSEDSTDLTDYGTDSTDVNDYSDTNDAAYGSDTDDSSESL